MTKKIPLINIKGESQGTFDIPESLFIEKIRNQAIFDVVLSEHASVRQGTHSTLTKGEVRGGGKKPWMQKHTGKARTGSTRNPHWVGGGVALGPKPNQNYMLSFPKKITKLALKSALTLRTDDLIAINSLEMKKPDTNSIYVMLKTAQLNNYKLLFIIDKNQANFVKSISNIPNVLFKVWNQVSVRDLLNCQKIVIFQNIINDLSKVVA